MDSMVITNVLSKLFQSIRIQMIKSFSKYNVNGNQFGSQENKFTIDPLLDVSEYTRSVQKIRGLIELRGSSWFQKKLLGVARLVQIR